MNIEKLILVRSGNKSVISKFLGKIVEAKEKSDKIEFNAILEDIETKTNTLDALDEKILSQTGVEDIEEELITTEEYNLNSRFSYGNLERIVKLPGGNNYFAGSQNSLGNYHSFMSASSQYHRLPKLSF
jgi:hypothetical protein